MQQINPVLMLLTFRRADEAGVSKKEALKAALLSSVIAPDSPALSFFFADRLIKQKTPAVAVIAPAEPKPDGAISKSGRRPGK